jgi:hypothetical protein
MARKIYKLVLMRGYTEAYYQLSPEEKQKLSDEMEKAVFAAAGAKVITPFCNCRWSTDQYATFFVMEYPDVEAAIADTAGVDKLDWYRYVQAETILGIDETA